MWEFNLFFSWMSTESYKGVLGFCQVLTRFNTVERVLIRCSMGYIFLKVMYNGSAGVLLLCRSRALSS